MGESYIRVTLESGSKESYKADYVRIDQQGGLTVVRKRGDTADDVAGFAPGKWKSWELRTEGDG